MRLGPTTPNSELALAQGIEQAQLFRQRPRRQIAAQGAFAFQNGAQLKGHGTSLGNCSY
ncbi:MAG: hypothetical protein ABSF38_00430 [Verrucomicrobiota bacterium]|jgi:hypothetical protein